MVRVRRIYDQAEDADGTRVLIDGLWPRGVSKDAARLDRWAKEVAPSTGLRRWYGHDPERAETFRARYLDELGEPEAAEVLDELLGLAREGELTLLTATKDVEHSHASVLVERLRPGRGRHSSDGSPKDA